MAANQHFILWWNLENLFDREDSPDRPAWLQSRLRSELRGWTQTILNRKIDNLATIIARTNNGNGPDILAVCEVENKPVVDALAARVSSLANRAYATIHHPGNDGRGIDIAFLYDSTKYRPDPKIFSLEVMKRNATRDLLQVEFTTLNGHELILIGNHWPARSAGVYESEPFRIMVAETLSYWLQRIQDIKGMPNVVLLGDFNDEPFNRAITDYMLSTHSRRRVQYARNPVVYNPMYELLGREVATFVWQNQQMIIDQIMVSKAISLKTNRYPFQFEEAGIVHYPEMTRGIYNTPIRFGRPSSSLNLDGYSDHLPIFLILEES